MGKLGDLTGKALGAPLRALIPKNPWLRLAVIALPVLIIASFLEPVLSLLGKGVDLITGTLTPLLDNAVGRLVLLNLIVVGVAVGAWYALRERWRKLRSGLVLRHHLAGVASLLGDERARTRELFRKVATTKCPPPAEFPHASEDAKIKLARLALEDGESDEALAWLTLVKEKKLPRELQRSLVQLRARALVQQGEVLPESVEKEVRTGLDRFARDPRLLELLRRQLLDRGALEEAARVQGELVQAASPRSEPAERQRWIDDLVRAGDAALAAGDARRAMKLAKQARDLGESVAAGCLVGNVRLAEGRVRDAIREWGSTRSTEGLGRIAEVLEQEPGAVSPRELLECCPTEGALLLAARDLARRGQQDQALRAARRAARTLGPTPTVTAVLSEILGLCGRDGEAAQLADEAVLRLVAPERQSQGG
ncbi:MAG: hypothetical protein AAF628_03670 [Planctomycetota bacterium]